MVGSIPDGRTIAVSFLATHDGFFPAGQVEPHMKTIDRHIGSSFLRSFGLVVIILVVLFSFLELLSQLDDVGKGNYQIRDVFLFIGLTLPRRMLDLMPISTLLGSVVALGLLADHGELLAMQAGGISVQRICWTMFATGTILIIFTAMLAEMIVPPLDQLARKKRARAVSGSDFTLTKQGFWVRRGNTYIHVGKTLSGNTASDLDIFEADKTGHLKTYTYAREANIQNRDQWVLREITRKNFTDEGIKTTRIPSLTLDSFLSSEQVGFLEIPADSLSSSDLYRYAEAMRENGQNVDRYMLSLWRKLSVPLSTGAMVLLSLTFVFGFTRRITAGKRIMVGSFVGVLFYSGDQVIVHLGLLLSLSPVIIAMTPVVLISGIALWKLRRAV
jgi:lipopolysaccharide export system permease protein